VADEIADVPVSMLSKEAKADSAKLRQLNGCPKTWIATMLESLTNLLAQIGIVRLRHRTWDTRVRGGERHQNPRRSTHPSPTQTDIQRARWPRPLAKPVPSPGNRHGLNCAVLGDRQVPVDRRCVTMGQRKFATERADDRIDETFRRCP